LGIGDWILDIGYWILDIGDEWARGLRTVDTPVGHVEIGM